MILEDIQIGVLQMRNLQEIQALKRLDKVNIWHLLNKWLKWLWKLRSITFLPVKETYNLLISEWF